MRPGLSLTWTSLIKLGWMDSKLLGFVCLCFLSPRKPVCLIWVLGLNSGPYTYRASALLTEPSHQSVPQIHQHCQEHLSMLYNGAIFIMSILTSVLLCLIGNIRMGRLYFPRTRKWQETPRVHGHCSHCFPFHDSTSRCDKKPKSPRDA